MMYLIEGLIPNSDSQFFTIYIPESLLSNALHQAFVFKDKLALPNVYIKVSQLIK